MIGIPAVYSSIVAVIFAIPEVLPPVTVAFAVLFKSVVFTGVTVPKAYAKTIWPLSGI
ncbi:hypothetical protein DSECCO2_487030 [anaerobic digester metagenome]